MGRTRQEPPSEARAEQQQGRPPTEAEVAAVIAAIIGGGVAAASVLGAVSFALRSIVAPFALAEEVADEITDSAATLVVTGPPSPPGGGIQTPLGRAHITNLIRRGQYAIAATKRMARRVGQGSSIAEAIRAEASYFRKHRTAEEDRLSAARMAEEALNRFGRMATWIHGDPKEPRPHHLAADGGQFDILDPPVSVGRVLPGVLPGCTCTTAPPRPGARRLV